MKMGLIPTIVEEREDDDYILKLQVFLKGEFE
jgi:hypothetical protein